MELKPCPFCGNPVETLERLDFSHKFGIIVFRCKGCGLEAIFENEDGNKGSPLSLWNSRI